MFFTGLGIKAFIKDEVKGILPQFLRKEEVERAYGFHATMEGYKATPLVPLNNLAKALGIGKIFVKDESFRFGLNSFKSLGGTYSIVNILCELLRLDVNEVTFQYFKRPEIKDLIKDITFVTATDGNHGRGVAWAARELGCKSVVYMPKGAAESRVKAIEEAGARVYVTDLNYDDAVRLAAQKAKEKGWYIVQDTAWEGYERIPTWITQGYTTMANEALVQLKLEGIRKPTHVFLQAGVGSLAGSVLGYYSNTFKGDPPTTIIVEPERAACIYESARAKDGQPHSVAGDLETIMAGLACGEPNTITWPILRDFAKAYFSCPDYVSAMGTRILASPIRNDRRIISGESGSVGIGLLSLLMKKMELREIKDRLGLNENSVILFFSTEGDTDPENYNKIVHEGKYPYPF